MVCSNCGMNNRDSFKFCVKCGSSLEAPKETDYEQVDMGNYHSEEEFSEDNVGFTMDTGTFVIKDNAPQSEDNVFYSADELNQSEEEFDFSIYDDPPTPSPKSSAHPQKKSKKKRPYVDFRAFFCEGNDTVPFVDVNDMNFFEKRAREPKYQSSDPFGSGFIHKEEKFEIPELPDY